MTVREEAGSLAGKAIRTIEEILTDSKVAPSVRLRAALAILAQASAPLPEPPAPESPAPQIVHNSAQSTSAVYHRPEPKIGRNEPCPCGSGRKFKLCCLNKPKSDGARNAAVTNVS
jgi:preprotein translocase subunit SecA